MSTARALQNDLQQATGVNVSDQTIRNRLHEGGLMARHPVVGPVLTARHRRARLAFAIDHQNWQLRHWCPVLFTDGSRFNLSTCDRREGVWRCRGERYVACTIIQHDRFGGIRMKSLGPLSEPTLVQWDQGSSWSTTMADLMWQESIRRCQVDAQTVQELSDALVQIWEEIPQDTIRLLIRSMPRHGQACVQARGGHTNY
ncbi:hypothetical protein D4764_12G0006960 [Takifugu flavidus]|uniref:Transposase Tc1-like domain-containing protein n=1 Tax=Takifugu flavidus TaxID=433684 RepID=A0A5C6PDN1_9TELE|nr:hypothetical protein D4764_12G0006960 [Takifugu flavidus]